MIRSNSTIFSMLSQHYRTYKRLSVARLFVLFIATFSFFWLSAAGGVPSKLGLGFSSKSTRVYSGNHAANAAVTVLQARRVTSQKNFTCARESSILLAEENMAALRPFFPAMPSEKHSDLKNEGWIQQICKPVFAHFEKFPLFTSSVHSRRYAISDTDYAVKGACMAYIAKSLAAANKRTSNLLKKSEGIGSVKIKNELLIEEAEINLANTLKNYREIITPMIKNRNYKSALSKLAELRKVIDNFFDNVMVLCDESELKKNRLALLSNLNSLFLEIADISKLQD